jgi:hypothetical protein
LTRFRHSSLPSSQPGNAVDALTSALGVW